MRIFRTEPELPGLRRREELAEPRLRPVWPDDGELEGAGREVCPRRVGDLRKRDRAHVSDDLVRCADGPAQQLLAADPARS